jgi:uncharacterized coiled-coil protein SlyX
VNPLAKKSTQKAAPIKELISTTTNSNDEISQLRAKFDTLANKFDTMEDLVNRYIARQEMKEIASKLAEHGINLDVP